MEGLDVGLKKERKLFSVQPDLAFTVKRKRKGPKPEKLSTKKLKLNLPDNETLSVANISEGQVVLGCVTHVMGYIFTVSLPHRVNGTVTITDVSQAYTNLLGKIAGAEDVDETVYRLRDLYPIGHLLCVKVKSISKNRRKIGLSLLPKDVNSGIKASSLTIDFVLQCAISSVEDKGYVLETGIPGIRAAFMSNKTDKEGEKLGVGSVFLARITEVIQMDSRTKVDGAKPVKIKVTREIADAVTAVDDDTNVMALLPGTLLEGEITSISKTNLKIKTGCKSDGIISLNHLQNPTELPNETYKIGQNVKARLLFTTNFTHVMHFSCNEKLQEGKVNTKILKAYKSGELLKNINITYTGGGGVHVQLGKNYHGFCPFRLLADGNSDKALVRKRFQVGSKVKCCVKSASLMDQMVNVTMKASVVDSKISNINELKPGQVVKATVTEHTAKGVNFTVEDEHPGSADFIHLTESCTKSVETIFPVGKTVEAKVMAVFKKKVVDLTLKPSLIESDLRPIKTYHEKVVNAISHGIIIGVRDTGLLVGFYNRVRGFIFDNLIIKDSGETLNDIFKIGQVIRCKVKSVDVKEKKMRLWLDSEKSVPKIKNKKVMKVVEGCTVKEVLQEEVKVTVKGMKELATIPVCHLSDSVELGEAMIKRLQVGDHIGDCYIFSFKATGAIITMKPSVCRHLSGLMGLKKFELSLKEGDVVPGVVSEVTPSKLKVVLPTHIYSRPCVVLKKNCPFVHHFGGVNTKEATFGFHDYGFEVGQTIFVKCLKIKENSKQPLLSLRLTKVMPSQMESSVKLLLDYLRTERLVRDMYLRSGGVLEQFAKIEPGQVLNGTVTAKIKYGALVLLDLKEGKKSKIEIEAVINCSGETESLVRNDKVCVTVIHSNVARNCLHVTLKKDVEEKTSKKGVSIGKMLTVEVIVIVKEFAIALYKGNFIYVCLRRHINDFSNLYMIFKAGENYDVIIRYKDNKVVIAEFADIAKFEKDSEIVMEEIDPKVTLEPVKEEYKDNLTLYKGSNYANEARYRIENVLSVLHLSKPHLKEVQSKAEKKDFEKIHQFSDLYFWDKNKRNREKQQKLVRLGGKKAKLEEDSEGTENTFTKKRKRKQKKVAKKSNGELNSDDEIKIEEVEDMEVDQELGMATKKNRKQKATRKTSLMQILNGGLIGMGLTNGDSNSENEIKTEEEEMEIKEEEIKEEYDECISDEEETLAKRPKKSGGGKQSLKALPLTNSGFSWFDDKMKFVGSKNNDDSSSDDEEEVEQVKTKKLTKAERLQKVRDEENRIHKTELTRLVKEKVPESAMDYEELLQSSPNSSAIWIQFISFHLQNAEIEKARSISRRALQNITATEEKERLNVWTVLLRLEVLYGDRDSVEEAFREALTTNDPEKIYQAMAVVYSEAGKDKEAEEIYKTMAKKFSQDTNVWIEGLLFLFKRKEVKRGREWLDRSLLSLPKKEHVDVIHRYAQFEFQYGEGEKGRTLYESLITNFPKRLDIWNVYADMLIKDSDIDGARRLLERMTLLKLRLPKMRSIFKRLLQFEQQHGTEQTVEEVKQKVEQYVNAALKEDS